MTSNRPGEILLVEDNDVDARMVIRASETTELPSRVNVVSDGIDALAYLRRANGHADAPRPDLVLLDLNLPGIHGLEVLQEMKADPLLHDIPVVILTSSSLEDDITATYRHEAAAFITKPTGIDGFAKVVNAIKTFWLENVTFADEPATN